MGNLITNRKARHLYTIETKIEAGVVLLGSEVKSLRAGNANLQDAWVRLDATSVWLIGCHISDFAQSRTSHAPLRERKLLLSRTEIDRLHRQVQQKGMAIVPLRIYVKGRYIKVEIATATGKKTYDKRRTLKERAIKRDQARGDS